jgi:hypothetical protein
VSSIRSLLSLPFLLVGMMILWVGALIAGRKNALRIADALDWGAKPRAPSMGRTADIEF